MSEKGTDPFGFSGLEKKEFNNPTERAPLHPHFSTANWGDYRPYSSNKADLLIALEMLRKKEEEKKEREEEVALAIAANIGTFQYLINSSWWLKRLFILAKALGLLASLPFRAMEVIGLKSALLLLRALLFDLIFFRWMFAGFDLARNWSQPDRSVAGQKCSIFCPICDGYNTGFNLGRMTVEASRLFDRLLDPVVSRIKIEPFSRPFD